jgi:HEAT repeat protein
MRQRVVAVLIVTLALRGAAAAEPAVDEVSGLVPEFAMYHDPELPTPAIELQLEAELLSLWRRALDRPEADMQRLAAQAIAQAAREGFPQLEECVPDLLQIATAAEAHPLARSAATDAVVALDADSAAQALFEMTRTGGVSLRAIVEPALAGWDFQPAREVWLARLASSDAGRRDRLLAIEGLGIVREPRAVPDLLAIVHADDQPADVRLAAAQAAGRIAESALEADAAQLVESVPAPLVNRLCAVALLGRHHSDAAVQQLISFAEDSNPSVVEQALGRLFEIDPALVVPLAEAAMSNADPLVRRRGAQAYIALPAPDRIHGLSRLLDDPHPDIRAHIAVSLYRHAARPDLNDAVRESATQVLAGDSWRGQEQAALLLGSLDHEPAAGRLLELLNAERSEVLVAAAWALKQLAIAETLPALLEHAQRQTDARRSGQDRAGLDLQIAHLFEAFGLMNFSPAEPLLRTYVPKDLVNGYYSRGAAVWSLGWLHAGHPDEDLAVQLVERLNDFGPPPIPPELDIVWHMSAVTLGRMRAESQLPALRERLKLSGVSHDPVACALRWSIEELSGEELPPLPPLVRSRRGSFLETLGDD